MGVAVMCRPDEQAEEVASRLAEKGLRISPHWNGHVEAEPVDEMTRLQETTKQKIKECREANGAKLIGHPDYRFNPRHSNNPDLFVPARAKFLAAIRSAAAADRERNPAFIRANAIRNIHAGA